jgi:flavin reductase (DIM6/NTAB) family NADH-FMN oxidoreductase RutF
VASSTSICLMCGTGISLAFAPMGCNTIRPVPGRSDAVGDELRSLMRDVPSGVAVLTVDTGGERLGLTVGTTLSLSLTPPLVGVSVSRQAAMHELLREAGSFALSILAGNQEAVAQHFARGVPPLAHWHGIEWREGASGAPLLDDALGWIEARVVDELETGDHTLFVGGVESVERGRSGQALVHVGQGYAAL